MELTLLELECTVVGNAFKFYIIFKIFKFDNFVHFVSMNQFCMG